MVRAYAYMCSTRAYSEPVRHHVPTHEKVLVCLRAHAMRGGHLSRVVSLLPPARTRDECVTTLHYYSSTSTTKRGPRAIHILAGPAPSCWMRSGRSGGGGEGSLAIDRCVLGRITQMVGTSVVVVGWRGHNS